MIRYRLLAAFVLATSFVAFPAASFAGVYVGVGFGGGGIGVSVEIAPPPLPVYEQPPCDVPDTVWMPGYWAYGPDGYYWVPGTWVEAPQVGYLWTPGYWGYDDGGYAWHGGYWGRHVGYYGGVDYGYGYNGDGYYGGGWNGDHFRYNTAYTNVNRARIENVYINRTVVNYYGNANRRTSYDGGRYGLRSRPTAYDLAYRNERHLPLTQVQRRHIETAAQNRYFLASLNHGRPNYAAVRSPLSRANRPAGFRPPTASDRRYAARANARPRYAYAGTGRSPSHYDRNQPSYARGTTRQANAPSRYGRGRSTTTNSYARFDRNATNRAHNAQRYARNSGTYHPQAIHPQRSYGQTRYANAYHPQYANRPQHSYGQTRNANAYHPQYANRAQRSYGQTRYTNAYHPQYANRAQRSYGQTRYANAYQPHYASRPQRSYGEARSANAYHPNYASRPQRSAYRPQAASYAARPSERSRPAEHNEARHSESHHREH